MANRRSNHRLSYAEIKRRVKELRARELANAANEKRESLGGVPRPHLDASQTNPPADTALTRLTPQQRNWCMNADNMAREFKGRYYRPAYLSQPDYQCEIKHVRNDGIVAGAVTNEGARPETHNILIHYGTDGGKSIARCNCDRSPEVSLCVHMVEFSTFLAEKLRDPNSSLSRKIFNQDFDSVEIDLSDYMPDHSSKILRQISSLFHGPTVIEDDELPEVKEKVPERLLWEFSITDGRLSVRTVFQRAKKRGIGWLKGKPIPLYELTNQTQYLISDFDRKAARAISSRSPNAFYSSSISLDFVLLIDLLREHPHVEFDDAPADLAVGEFRLALQYESDHYTIKLLPPLDRLQATHQIITDQGVVFINRDLNWLTAVHCSSEQIKMLRELARNPLRIPKKKLNDNLHALYSLAENLPIAFPPELAGEIRPDTARAAILLRSRTTGELDFGLRIRTESGQLFRPAQGPICKFVATEKEKVQWQRNPAREREVIDNLADRLGIVDIDDESYNDTVDDFGRGLLLLEAIHDLGDDVEVCWDRRSERRPALLGSVSAKNLRVQIETKRDWFGIEGQCELDGKSVNLSDILATMVQNDRNGEGSEFIQVAPDQWARVSERLHKRLLRLADHAHSERGNLKLDRTAVASIEALMNEDVEIAAPPKWSETVARLRKAEKLQPVVPANLHADLRSYQEEGFAWMRRLAEWGVGGVLADDMGLGKTVQTLAVLIDRSDTGPTLVIAPTSVGFNWAREAERFAPTMKAHLYRDTDRNEFLSKVGPGDIVICSYGLALRDEKLLSTVNWSTMVLDEAQAIKNSRSKTTRAVTMIPADWKIALTGTPAENHLGELWSIFRVVSPGLLGGWDQFKQKFAAPIERENCPKRRKALSEVLQPFILRRTKQSVLKELPERTESNLYVDLSKDERARYESWRLAALGEIEGIEEMTGTGDGRFQILAVLTRLRQLACNVGLVDKNWKGRSSKLELLMEKMQELRSEGHRALIFSQFTEHLGKIREAFDAAGITYQYLDGSTPAKSRGDLVDKFQAGEGDAFLISLKAGGTGLNLTAADYVIHMDPWWNPAVEDQATDRAHRIGQENPVMVYRIVARGTIEEEILRLHESKRDLVAGILDGTSKAAKLSTEELVAMIRGEK